MRKINCPVCNKELIRLEPFENNIFEFWCDNCDIDITVTKNRECEEDKYICDCCGKETDVDNIVFHSDYAIGICTDCYNKMDDDGEYELWYACQDCQFCTADMVHDMLKKLNDRM